MRITRLLSTTALIGAALAVSAPAWAQNLPDEDQPQPTTEVEIESGTAATGQDDVEDEAIVVTGSRIRRPNLDSAVPIVSIGGEEFFQTGQISIGDVLNELPQLRSTFSQQNSNRFLGTSGLNLLDLRGLGSERTLVLVNGRRHVGGDVLSTGTSPDTNTFPTDLIERTELITGGGSSIYGSDAIAGTINFILKRDFEGVQLRGQAGVSGYGDAGNQYVSLLAGKNFGDGRGNIAINLEYAHQDDYYASGRPSFRQANGFVVVDTDLPGSANLANGSDGNPDRIFFRDIRSTTARGGQTFVRQPVTGNAGGLDLTGAAFTLSSLFLPDGSLVPQTGSRVGLAPLGTFIGGNGVTGREDRLLALSPQLDRYSVNVLGHFEIAPAFVPFVEAKYVRSESLGSQSGPFFSQGQTIGDGFVVPGFEDRSYVLPGGRGTTPGSVNREGIRVDNPFLSAQARAEITRQLLATTINPNTGAAFVQGRDAAGNPVGPTPAEQLANQRAQINNGTFRFNNRKNFTELGVRNEDFRRETYRVVAGVRGDFLDDWNFEISGNYGRLDERNAILGNVNTQRFLLANDSARNAAGQIVCRSQIDPRFAGPDAGGNPAVLAADIAACVPLNPFGEGASSQAARDYLLVDSLATGRITQLVGSAFVAGDFSELFELPGGPIGFSVGAEYRRDTLRYDLDDLTQNGYAFYNAIPTFRSPAAEVKEAYGEISIPILKDVPFFQELTATTSGRISDYKGATGTVYTYGGDLVWRPIQDIRFRGSYNRAVRAPNLSERFSEQSQNFAPAPADPCSARNLATGSANRVANCTAAGRPADFDYVYTSSLEIVSGGNPGLQEEKSDNYTVGGVLTPRFLPGLSVSVDYFDITVKDVITAVSAQQILNSCYDAASLDNIFCNSFERAGAGGGPRGEQQFRVLEGSLLASTLNFASLKVRGIDSELAYRRNLGNATVGLRAIWTHAFQNDEFTNPADPGRANRVNRELGDPQDEVNVDANVRVGKVTFGYQFRFIEKQVINAFEDIFSVQGRDPENADYADQQFYPNVYYSDIRLDFEADKTFNLYVGVDNVTNRLPPLGATGIGGGSGIYDNRGRYFYAGAKATF